MLSKQDIALLRGMFDDTLKENNVSLKQEIQGSFVDILKQNNIDLTRDIRDEMHSCIAASEARMIARMDKLEKKIISDVTDFVDTALIPQIDSLRAEDARIRKFVGMA